MKTRRAISINNSLVHGICNYSCRLCSINTAGYDGPTEFQSYTVTRTLIQRVIESAESGIHIRYIANSGDGEPTLHPEFTERIRMFGDILREWNSSAVPPPEVSVVTNGSRLNSPGIMDTFLENRISLII
jgi:wyosine [tRNA(Phe)-imidazoG37] synthetase (radical SAM superfamily)